MQESGGEWVGNDAGTLRELVEGDPDSQGSKIVKVRSSLLLETSEEFREAKS